MMSKIKIEKTLQEIARDLKLRDPEIHVETTKKFIHLLIAAPDFKGKTAMERENIVWRELEHRLDDETLLSITQCYLLTPEEKAVAVPN